MQRSKLGWRLFVPFAGIAAAAMLIAGEWTLARVHEEGRRALARSLEAQCRQAVPIIAERLAAGDLAGVESLCRQWGEATGTRFTVILADGRLVGDSHFDPPRADFHADRPEVRAALAGEVGRGERFSDSLRETLYYVAVPLIEEETVTAVVRTAASAEPLGRLLSGARWGTVVAALLALAVMAVAGRRMARRVTRPLAAFQAVFERWSAGDLSARAAAADTQGILEMETLAAAINAAGGELAGRMETILRQLAEQEAMLSSMDEGVLAVDGDGRILTLNDRCRELLGINGCEARGRLVHEVIRKPDLLTFLESALAENAGPVEGDIRLHDPHERSLRAHGTPLCDAARRPIGALIVLHDMTRLQQLENVRRDFVANVSHELRTPITSIKGFVETLIDGALVEEPENALRFLNIVLRQVNRLDAIIEDLLLLSNLERGVDQRAVRLQTGAIREVLVAACEMCDHRARAKDISVDLRCGEDLTAAINGPLLEQAVVNLVDNAVKYSEAGSRVEVSAEKVPTGVMIRVRDEGCGIEAQHLPRLFERFYRVDRARSRELGGTGLGLAIVKHVALAHRGEVAVESSLGRGSVFSIQLPLHAKDDS